MIALAASVLGLAMARQAKTSEDGALNHPARQRLLETVRATPGARLRDLSNALAMPRETAQYHLFVLERIGFIKSTRAEGTSRYFPAGTEDIDAWAVLMRGRILYLCELVLSRPGSNQTELVHALGIDRKVFRGYANLLIDEELVQEIRVWRERRYYATERLRGLVDRPGRDGPGTSNGDGDQNGKA